MPQGGEKMDFKKLRGPLLEFLSRLPYVPTYEVEPLTDRVVELVKGQLEQEAPEPAPKKKA
jgi:hypothetical protein